ncbi:MAG: hypothetical protein WCK57_00630 [Verrucomicrobiae bacterium]
MMPAPRTKDIYDDAHEWRKSTDTSITSLRGDVSELKTGLGEVKAGQRYLADTVNGAVQAFQQAAKPKETQWGVLIALLTLITIIAGGFTTLTTNPIITRQEKLLERVQSLEDTDKAFSKFQGQSETWREKTKGEMDILWLHAQEAETHNLTLVESTAYARGRQDAYEGRLDRLSQRLEKLGERTYQAKP